MVLLAAFLLIEKRAREPVLPLALFRIRTISSSFVVQFVRGSLLLGLVAFTPLLVQGAVGGTIEDTRNVLYAFVIPFVVGSISSGQFVARLGYRKVTFIGSAILAAGGFALASLGPSPSVIEVMERGAIVGLGQGITITSVLSAFQNSVDKRQIGVASSLATFSLNLGGAIGVGILGALQANSLSLQLSNILQQSPPQYRTQLAQLFANPDQVGRILTSPQALAQVAAGNPIVSSLISQVRGALGQSIVQSFLLLSVLSVIALIASLFITGSAGKSQAQE